MPEPHDVKGPNTPTVPAPSLKDRWKYEDPNPDASRKGLLLSNEIERFCNQKLLIDENFLKKQVRPAAYTLRIGTDYVDSRGKRDKLSKNNPSFYIEPNSIAYVSTLESLDLPYYIAARFNLRVTWVYRGVLLGAGPQVEPGYRGFLSCPLFNLTDKAIKVTYEEDFASIDFERTSDFCPGKDWKWIKENIARSPDVEKLEEVKIDSSRFLLFKQKPYLPLKHLPDWDVVSSLMQLSNEVKTWRNIGIGIVIAFFGLTLSLLSFQNNLYRELRSQDSRLVELGKGQTAIDSKLSVLESRLNDTRDALRSLEGRVKLLEEARSAMKKPPMGAKNPAASTRN